LRFSFLDFREAARSKIEECRRLFDFVSSMDEGVAEREQGADFGSVRNMIGLYGCILKEADGIVDF
jgi:hypothetical protein